MDSIHITTARRILDSGKPVSLTFVKKTNGAVVTMDSAVSIKYDFNSGRRIMKNLRNGQKRTIYDVLIIGLDDFDVFL